jgi:uncharacterized membrane protein
MPKRGRKAVFSLFCLIISLFGGVVGVRAAADDNFEALVTEIQEKQVMYPGSECLQPVQVLQARALTGTRSGELVTVNHDGRIFACGAAPVYQVGQRLVIYGGAGAEHYAVADVVRRPALVWLAVIFVALAVAVGRWRGLAALAGLAVSFLVIFYLVLPQIAAGANPVVVVILASLLIIPAIFVLAHGWNRKTIVAMIATLLSMIVTGILIAIFVSLARLTGLASEEAGFVQALSAQTINLKNLLIAGMLIATLGVLDDITVSQAAVVMELKAAQPELKFGQLYRRAMKVGRDHIASMINTLILVYAGASLPLLLLFLDSGQSLGLTLNFEIVAVEVVRTLTESVGLMLAVPVTTALAAWWGGGEF